MRETASPGASPNPRSQGPFASAKRARWLVPISVCLTLATCYFRNFVHLRVPVMSWGDQMLFAADGARIVAGQMPYRDYFQFVTPGTDLVYALLFRLLGARIWIPNLVMVSLAALAVLLTTLAAKKVLQGNWIALPAVLSAGFVFYGSMDATHHWFSTIVILLAMLVLLQDSQPWHIAAAGALCGVAASFTQSKGALALIGFMVYFVWQSRQNAEASAARWRKCLLLCVAALGIFVVINGRYVAAIGIRQWIESILIFPIRYYPTIPNNSWRAPWVDFHNQTGLVKWICIPFLYATVPLVYLIFLRVMHHRRRIETKSNEPESIETRSRHPWNQLLLIAITGLAMFLPVAPYMSVRRVSSVSLPAMILLAWLLHRYRRPGRIAAATLAALSLAVATYLPIRAQTMHWHYLDLPAGRTAILDPGEYDLYQWMAQHTHPGETYFGITPLSLPLDLQSPAPIQSPGPWEYYRPEHIAAAIDAIEQNRIPLLVLRSYTNYAGSRGYEADHLQSFQAYVEQHYRPIKTFSTGDTVWQRRDPKGNK